MACKYIKGFNGERVLVPGCWNVVNSNDMSQCTCDRGKEKEDKIELLELRVKKLENIICSLSPNTSKKRTAKEGQ